MGDRRRVIGGRACKARAQAQARSGAEGLRGHASGSLARLGCKSRRRPSRWLGRPAPSPAPAERPPLPTAPVLAAILLLALAAAGCAKRDRTVELRPFPYPYRAGLAIASDADEMDSAEEFLAIHRFLADTGPTPLGEGLGMEISGSFWFFDAGGRSQFTWFQDAAGTPSAAAGLHETFVAAGYLDCIHGYGEFGGREFTREFARACLAALAPVRERYGRTVRVWSHHGDAGNRQNLGPLTFEKGDDPGAPEYHADLLLESGVKFLDLWEVTHIIGQDAGLRWTDWLKEAGVLLVHGKNRATGVEQMPYLRSNDLVRAVTLDDGRRAYAYRRFFSSWGGGNTDVPGLADQISGANLDELVAKQGAMIVYTHLGGNEGIPELIPARTREALAALARRSAGREVLVTTPSRLLTYSLARRAIEWSWRPDGQETRIEIARITDEVEGAHLPRPEELMGLTFYVPDAERTRVVVGGIEWWDLDRNPPDASGRESVGFRWRPLEFPEQGPDGRWRARWTP